MSDNNMKHQSHIGVQITMVLRARSQTQTMSSIYRNLWKMWEERAFQGIMPQICERK